MQAVSSGIKLNPRKLYASNFATAKELLKVTSALLNSPQNIHQEENRPANFEDVISNDQIRKVRNLSTELVGSIYFHTISKFNRKLIFQTGHGVNMYDLISKETVNKDARTQFSKPLELSVVEKMLKQSISNLKNQISNGNSILETQSKEKANLESKIQRKESELERTSHRLATLQKIRPAYLEEFEKIEQQMKELYAQYTRRVRCYDALKGMLSNSSNQSTTSYSPIQKAHDSIPILPEEGLTDEEEEGDNDSTNTDFKDDQSLLNQDIFKQVSSRLVTRGERKVGNEVAENRELKITDELSGTESTPSSDDLESGELDFSEF